MIGLHSIENYVKLDQEQRRAVAVSTIATRIQSTEYSLEAVIYQILTAITAAESLGFSRAMLFLRDEHAPVLRGFCAAGEATSASAQEAWEPLRQQRSIERAFDDAVQYFQAVQCGKIESPFIGAIRSTTIPLSDAATAVARCVSLRPNQFVNVDGNQSDAFRAMLAGSTGTSYDGISFACVPLLGREETIGVLVVDERFKPHERRRIPEDRIAPLTAYAELAAITVETHRLSEKTQTHTYEDLAHQLRHPVALASDYCKMLADNSKGEDWNADAFELLRSAVDKAVHVGKKLQRYSDLAAGRKIDVRAVRLRPEPLLSLILEAVRGFETLSRGKRLTFDVRREALGEIESIAVQADMTLVREALENILDNAVKYSYTDETVTVTAECTDGRRGFQLVVENIGLPIQPEEIDFIAQRGYRGRSATDVTGEGSGIGLWVVNGIMRAQSGKLINYPTTPEGCTRVALWFPVNESTE